MVSASFHVVAHKSGMTSLVIQMPNILRLDGNIITSQQRKTIIRCNVGLKRKRPQAIGSLETAVGVRGN